MREALSHAIAVFDVGVILYFITLNTLYLAFTAIAFFELRRRRKRWTPRDQRHHAVARDAADLVWAR
jgi:hypothetical protein